MLEIISSLRYVGWFAGEVFLSLIPGHSCEEKDMRKQRRAMTSFRYYKYEPFVELARGWIINNAD